MCGCSFCRRNNLLTGRIGAGVADIVEDASSDSAQTYANILVVKEGNEDLEKIQVLAKALQSETVRAFMEEQYAGAVVPIF